MREMKDSGIDWVHEIPISWNIKKNKYNFTLKKTIVGTKWENTQLLSLTKYGIAAIKDGEQTGKVPASLAAYQKVDIDDIVMCLFDLDCSAVFSGRSPFEGMISPAYKCFKCLPHIHARYVDYYFRTVFVGRKYMRYSKNVRYSLNADEFMALPILVPPLEEQRRIADFLDRECAKIDLITADIEKQIEILEQYKRSVISERVTKGMDCSVGIISCDAKWLPMIPKNWSVKRGKYCFIIRNTKGNNITLELLSPTQKYGVIPQRLYEEYSTQVTVKVNERTNLRSFKTIHPGDFCISLRSFEGGFEYSTYEGVVSPAYTVFYPTIKCDRRYYKYLFKISQFIAEMNSYSLSLRDGKPISFDDFANTYIPIPPLKEQQAIADYLDKKCAEIDGVIADKKEQLDVLENYKKSIIYEYVTGKKEA